MRKLAFLLWLLPSLVLAGERIPYANPMDKLIYHDKDEVLAFASDRFSFFDIYDPLEPINRIFFRFNVQLDQYVLKPIMNLYEALIPGFMRQGVANFFQNLKDVPNTLNNLAQLKGEAALNSSGRLLINSTLGMLGVFDPAESMGITYRRSDIGMTLAHYGVSDGPYLMIPVLGPYNLRDTVGMVLELYVEDWANYLGVSEKTFSELPWFAAYGINYRYKLQLTYDDFSSPFSYDMIRFLYSKKRELELIAAEAAD
ncbi:hypothetical protein ACH42_05155 [Endozoicomonas sp. (ex Bugula neritina AB1)]|nr:hypothetical protein ACH42_05155 [Endozoicomonas sp. (ex Bugula neritina AB1)]